MSETQEQIRNLEQLMEENKRHIHRMEMLERLEKNADFKELIIEGFLEKHAIRQVMLKAHPSLQDEDKQKLLDQQIMAIGGFKQFLISITSQGRQAVVDMAGDEETLEELMKEELEQ